MLRNSTFARVAWAIFFAVVCSNMGLAANYYWRAVALNNLFTNPGNWETSPGGGLSPAIAPGVNDDVFFPVSSNMTTISLNTGLCRDFVVSAPNTTNFIFSGLLTEIHGSLMCANGNATFQFSGTQKMTGNGNHVIDLGSPATQVSGGFEFFSPFSAGSYTLLSALNVTGSLLFQGQSFQSSNFPMSCAGLQINGSTVKTIDFGTSLITFASTINGGVIHFASPNATTTYLTGNSRWDLTQKATSFNSGMVIYTGVVVALNEVTLNAIPNSNNALFFDTANTDPNSGTLQINTLRINVGNVLLGRAGFVASNTGNASNGFLDIDQLIFQQPSTISSDSRWTVAVNQITEPTVCAGQSAMVCTGYSRINLNAGNPLSTTTIAYSGINFGGSGISSTSSMDLGNNSGLVSWGPAVSGQTFYWAGASGNWDDPTQWSLTSTSGPVQGPGGCLPSLVDDVVMDAGSFTAAQTVKISVQNGFCRNISWTGNHQGFLSGGLLTSTVYEGNLFVNGNADFSGSRGIGANVFFVGAGNHTVTSGNFAPYSSKAIRFMGTGTYTLTDALRGTGTASNGTFLQHTAGALVTAGQIIDVENFCSRSYPELATNPRSLNVSNSEINIRGYTIVGGRRNIDLSFLTALSAANSHFQIHSNNAATAFTILRGSATASYLSTATLHDVSFTATSGAPIFAASSATGATNYTINFNDVSFASNGSIVMSGAGITHNVNNYNFSSGHTYSFTASTNTGFNVLSGINTVVTGCQDLIRIQSSTVGNQAKIYKAAAPFDVMGAIVTDIFATGTMMNVVNGVDGFNNTNVTVSLGIGRDMFWVNDAGDWDDGLGHWSIGQSGGDPNINNPLGCIPRAIDNVFFDDLSFASSAQLVHLNIDGNCRNMLWTSQAGADLPRFNGLSTQNLNVYGRLEMGAGMQALFPGRIFMQGTNPGVNMQSIRSNGVDLNASLWLNGGGRYDLLDPLNIVLINSGLTLTRGNFQSHGFDIYASAMALDVRNGSEANISNSKIRLFNSGTGIGQPVTIAYKGTHNATGIWNAAGSEIQTDNRNITISNTVPVIYGDIHMNSTSSSAQIIGSSTQLVTFERVLWLVSPSQATGGSVMNGQFLMDTLQYPVSSYNTLVPGGTRSYTVFDTLILQGTPCSPAFLRSSGVGMTARLNSANCNFDFQYANLQQIQSINCYGYQNRARGNDDGGNVNWTITGFPGLHRLGNDTTIDCNADPLVINTGGFGNVPGMGYLWNTGSTADSLATVTAGTYVVTVSFAGNCNVVDSLRVFCTVPLPLSELVLQAEALVEGNLLTWDFEFGDLIQNLVLLRSLDGQTFAPIYQYNAPSTLHYRYLDPASNLGTQYYRLQAIAKNGENTYSNIAQVRRDQVRQSSFSYAPNPTTDVLQIQGNVAGAEIQLYDLRGVQILPSVYFTDRIDLDLRQIPNGIYSIVIRKGGVALDVHRIQVLR